MDYKEAFAFKCPESKQEPHLAVIDIERKSWCCPKNIMREGPLETTELVWYGENQPSYPSSTSNHIYIQCPS